MAETCPRRPNDGCAALVRSVRFHNAVQSPNRHACGRVTSRTRESRGRRKSTGFLRMMEACQWRNHDESCRFVRSVRSHKNVQSPDRPTHGRVASQDERRESVGSPLGFLRMVKACPRRNHGGSCRFVRSARVENTVQSPNRPMRGRDGRGILSRVTDRASTLNGPKSKSDRKRRRRRRREGGVGGRRRRRRRGPGRGLLPRSEATTLERWRHHHHLESLLGAHMHHAVDSSADEC